MVSEQNRGQPAGAGSRMAHPDPIIGRAARVLRTHSVSGTVPTYLQIHSPLIKKSVIVTARTGISFMVCQGPLSAFFMLIYVAL